MATRARPSRARVWFVVFAWTLWGTARAGPDLCLPENGGRVTASSQMRGYEARHCTDGLRSRDFGYWNDATKDRFPDWVQVAWTRPRRIGQVRAALPFMPVHSLNQRTVGSVRIEWWDLAARRWRLLTPTNGAPNPARAWVAPRTPEEDRMMVWTCAGTVTTKIRIVFEKGQGDGWSLLDEIEVFDMNGPETPELTVEALAKRPELDAAETVWKIGRFDGRGGGLFFPPKVLRDDGRYQDGGYWATPLAWFMVAVMRLDPECAACTFCDAVADFQARDDVNEWITDSGAGVREYCASAAMPLEGVRRLRAHLARTGKHLPPELGRKLDVAEEWLRVRAKKILRSSSRVGKNSVRIFTPDASGGYGAFWVRDWSYSLEGCPEASTHREIHDGYLFLAAAQREDGCMPDRVRPDGVGVYSPGPEQKPLSANGSVDQSPFMVIVCHQVWKLCGDLEPFRRTAAALEKAMRFTPRNPQNGLVTITDATLFRPYSFLDSVPLVGDEQFSCVLFWDACRKLAEMFSAVGETKRAAIWRREAARVRESLSGLWDERAGVFLAASRNWRQPSVWGSVFAVYAGLADDAQSERVARFCLDNYNRIVKRGQVRHLLKGTFWGRPETEYTDAWDAFWQERVQGISLVLDEHRAQTDFPATQPGEVNGNAPVIRIRFRLATVPKRARFVVGLQWDERCRRAPVGLQVTVNGHRGVAALLNAGREALGLDKEWPAAVAFHLPPDVLEAGENQLTLTVRGSGSWQYDGLALTADAVQSK